MSCLCAAVALFGAIVPVHAQTKSALLDAVPDDVYLVVNGRHNPEQDFLNAYWDEVWAAFCQSGLQKDFMELIGIAAGQEQVDQMGQMTSAYGALFEAIDWSTIAHEQTVFAIRMSELVNNEGNIHGGPPDFVMILGGAPGSGESNFNAISAIVDTVGAQVGAMAGEGMVRVEKSEKMGASVVTLGKAPDVQGPNYGLGVARNGDTIVLTLGDKMLGDVLGLMSGQGDKKAISQSSRFRTAFETLPKAENELMFFDMHQLTGAIQKMVDVVATEMHADEPAGADGGDEQGDAAGAQGPSEVQMVMKVVGDVLGMMNTIDYVAQVSYTDGHSVHQQTIAAVPDAARDTAFFKVCNSGKQLKSFEKYIPAEAQSFAVDGGLDAVMLYGFIEDFVRSFGPQGEGMLAQWESMQEQFGLNVRDDVLAWMGGPTASIKLENGESVMLMEVKDAEAATARISSAIAFAESQLQQMATQNPMMGMIGLSTAPVLHEKLEGFQAITMAMIPKPMVWGVRDGQLMIGSSAEAVALCLATAEGKHPNIKSNERVMSEAVKPDGAFQSIAYTDLRNMGNDLAQACSGLGMAGSMMVMMAPPEAQKPLTKALQMVAKLGTVARKIDFYKSRASVTTIDKIGWRTKGVTHYQSPSERAKTDESATATQSTHDAQ